ncbi:MAG: hypothetical protein AAFW81_07680 [Pseudomonadota bacterium]
MSRIDPPDIAVHTGLAADAQDQVRILKRNRPTDMNAAPQTKPPIRTASSSKSGIEHPRQTCRLWNFTCEKIVSAKFHFCKFFKQLVAHWVRSSRGNARQILENFFSGFFSTWRAFVRRRDAQLALVDRSEDGRSDP